MSIETGVFLRCDHHSCNRYIRADTQSEVLELANQIGWSQSEYGKDYCYSCTHRRSKRKKVSEIVPAGVRLMLPFEAAEAAGWERIDYDEEKGTAHFYCCGEEVNVTAILGMPYHAECAVCGAAIKDVLFMADPDKVDTEDPKTWVLVSEYKTAELAE